MVTRVHQAENEAWIYIENNAILQQIANYNVSDSYASAVFDIFEHIQFPPKSFKFLFLFLL